MFGFGYDISDYLFGITRYTVGGTFMLNRGNTSGSYSGSLLYARIEHPFNPKNTNNYIGVEVNTYIPSSFSINNALYTELKGSPGLGFAIYERMYFSRMFIEAGIRGIAFPVNGQYSGADVEIGISSVGTYFVLGMTL